MSTDKTPLPVVAWQVIAKGGKFTRGLYESCREEWELDDDTQHALTYLSEADKRIASLEAELAAVRVNAERYKTWREVYAEDSADTFGLMVALADAWTDQQIDAAIDAARATKGAA